MWNEGKWEPPRCNKGLCIMSQINSKCSSKKNGHQLGDQTWCWNGKRSSRCPSLAQGLICLFHSFTLFLVFYNVFKLQIYYLGKQLSFLVDCKWGNWTFGECSSSCGGGIRLDTRQELVDATNGGKECTGPSNLTENCNIQECPGKRKFFLCNSNLV